MWEAVFAVTNGIALASHGTLIALPRRPLLLTLVLYAGVFLLCLIYAIGLIGLMTGGFDQGAGEMQPVDFTSLDGITGIFATQGGAVIGWTHYLAFDLFVALWIARDADAKGFSRIAQVPVLLATFMAGPIGLLVWLVVREPRARKAGRPR